MRVKPKKIPQKISGNNPDPIDSPVNWPRLFLLIGGFFGLVMLVLTPPFQVPDEHDHFFRAVMISSGQFVAKSYPFSEELKKKVPKKYLKGKGGIVPVSIPYTTRNVNHKLPFHPENKQQFSDLKKMLALPLHMKGMPEVFINTSAGGYAPPLYLPAALTIAVGKSFNLSALWLMYLGRLANLMVFLSLIYWTLRITPTGKPVIFLLALMPMTLFLAPSLSIDGLIIASSILLTATLMDLAQNDQQPTNYRDWFIVPITLTILTLGKVVYCPLILLFFLSPKALFSSDRSRLFLFTSSLVLAAGCYIIWHWLTNNAGTASVTNIPFDYTSFQAKDQLMPLLNSKKQLQFLQHHPSSIFTILIRTLQDQGLYYIESFIGLLGWLDTKLPFLIYISFPFALIASALDSKTLKNHVLTEKVLFALIWIISTSAILIGFYLLSTPVSNAIIGGIQGRYFIPIALPFLLLFCADYPLPTKTNYYPLSRLNMNWPTIYVVIVLLTTASTIWCRYY
ncbi:MAG: hypothetical protein DRH03_02235 [Deltaproteobacteria bacterium]|nr:MAG: hypothetical protein DRH03_02235 [Deltaproteobacteria bacterium]